MFKTIIHIFIKGLIRYNTFTYLSKIKIPFLNTTVLIFTQQKKSLM